MADRSKSKISPLAWLGDTVSVGAGCKIQAFAFIPDGVILEDGVFIGPHACFCNDRYPPSNGAWKNAPPIVVERGAAIGANATILPGVRIGAFSMVGAGAVVTSDVGPGVVVAGNPATYLRPVSMGGRPPLA